MATKVQRRISGTFRNARWPSESARRVTAVPSAEQQARWKEEKAAWRLANRGDNWYSAHRRLFRMQMTTLRREWELDALARRREEYVQRRAAQRQAAAEKVARAQEKERRAAEIAEEGPSEEELERQTRLHKEYQERRRQRAHLSLEKKEQAEADARREWLSKAMNEHDFDAKEHRMHSVGKRILVTPENLNNRLQIMMLNTQSPVLKWDNVARERAKEDATLSRRVGGQYVGAAEKQASDEVSQLLAGVSSSWAENAQTLPPGDGAKAELSSADADLIAELSKLSDSTDKKPPGGN